MDELTTPEGVLAHMSESTSEEDWVKRCDDVRAANDGLFPSFWLDVVVNSGFAVKKLRSVNCIDLRGIYTILS